MLMLPDLKRHGCGPRGGDGGGGVGFKKVRRKETKTLRLRALGCWHAGNPPIGKNREVSTWKCLLQGRFIFHRDSERPPAPYIQHGRLRPRTKGERSRA